MDKPAIFEREHARLGPSGWKRWSVCHGSQQLIEQLAATGFPVDEANEYSAEGTAMHWVREQCLLTGKDANEYIGHFVQSDGYTFEFTPEWARWLQPGIDRLREEGGTLLVEQRVYLDEWAEGEFGTVDSVVIPDSDDGLIIVDDFKGGRGVIVPAYRNGQLMQYALGVWRQFIRGKSGATRFKLRIDQPRAPGGGDEWECTLDELIRFGEDEYVPAARATWDPDAALVPTPEGCQFCPVARAAQCGALNRHVLATFGLTLDDLKLKEAITMPELEPLTPEQRSAVVKQQSMLRKWIGSVHDAALGAGLRGEPTPGFKVVDTEGDRQWVSEEKAEQFFDGRVPKKEMYVQRLKSPTQMEVVAGTRIWAKAQELIHRPPGPPALVPETDKRPARKPLADLLDDLTDDELVGAPDSEDFDDLI